MIEIDSSPKEGAIALDADATIEQNTESDPIDCVRLQLGEDVFKGKQIHKFEMSEHLDGNRVVKSSSIVLNPLRESTWDYNSETVLNGPVDL